jgi:hypothetical protein
VPNPITADPGVFADAIQRRTELAIRTMQPAKVLAYNPATQRVKIELGFIEVRRHQDGTETEQAPVVLENVPALQLGDPTSYLVHPIAVGSHGMALVCDRSLAAWRTDGKAHAPSLPQTHNLADIVFLPGLTPDPSPLPPASMGGMALEATTIQLGAAATPLQGAARVGDPVAINAVLATLLGQLVAAVNTLAPGSVTPTAIPPTAGNILTGSTKVFVQ